MVNLGRLIRSTDDMLRRALGEGVEIETIISGGLWNTFVDTVQVENALLNLAINARDAMEGHGKLTIEAGNAFLDDDYAARHAEVDIGQYVIIAVTDTGCGIPAEIIEHVFEPFFTTKPEGRAPASGSAWSTASSSSPAAMSKSTASRDRARPCESICRARESRKTPNRHRGRPRDRAARRPCWSSKMTSRCATPSSISCPTSAIAC